MAEGRNRIWVGASVAVLAFMAVLQVAPIGRGPAQWATDVFQLALAPLVVGLPALPARAAASEPVLA